MAGETNVFFLTLRATQLLADRIFADRNFSGYCFLLPSKSNVAGSRMVKEFTFGGRGTRPDYGGWRSKEASKEIKILFIGIVCKATWKAMRKKHSSNCSVSQHFFSDRWVTWVQKPIDFDLQWEEESDFLHAVAIQDGKKIQSDLRRKQIFVMFNNCLDTLQNVDEIVSLPFPVT